MEPTLSFIYNTGTNDTAYAGVGQEMGDWKVMSTVSGTNFTTDKMVFTGGGILGTLSIPTCVSGTRDSTIKPTLSSYVIPQTYVETSVLMYNVPMAGFGGASYSTYRYVFGVYVNGTMNSDLYLEAWDDNTFSTVSSEVLQGTAGNGNVSMINAIRTTSAAPPWSPGWSGGDASGEYLRGTDYRLPLANTSSVTDQAVYYNIYIRLPTDCTTFHNTPILGFRYLYT